MNNFFTFSQMMDLIKNKVKKMALLVNRSTGTTQISTTAQSSANVIDVKAIFGAKGDSATDDTPAIQNAINSLVSAGGGTLHFPVGTYILGSSLNLVQATGVNFTADGGDNTTLYARGAYPAVQVNGATRCYFQGIRFQAGASNLGKGVFELDGNYDGTHTMGVQGCTFMRCYFDGALLSDYSFSMTRQSNSGTQNTNCLFVNCNFDAGVQASFFQGGSDSLCTTFIGGNFQSAKKNAIQINKGTISVFSVGFQADQAYNQVINNGWDIDASNGTSKTAMIVNGCRTESVRFINGNSNQQIHVSSVNLTPPYITFAWTSGLTVPLNSIIKGNVGPGQDLIYLATTAGVTGTTQPVWPASGSITDGTVVWTASNIVFMNIPNGSIKDITSSLTVPGNAIVLSNSQYPIVHISTSYTASFFDEIIAVDTTAGSRSVTVPEFLPHGKRFTVKKVDSSANTLTVICDGAGLEFARNTIIPGGSPGYLNFFYDATNNMFYLTGKG